MKLDKVDLISVARFHVWHLDRAVLVRVGMARIEDDFARAGIALGELRRRADPFAAVGPRRDERFERDDFALVGVTVDVVRRMCVGDVFGHGDPSGIFSAERALAVTLIAGNDVHRKSPRI